MSITLHHDVQESKIGLTQPVGIENLFECVVTIMWLIALYSKSTANDRDVQ